MNYDFVNVGTIILQYLYDERGEHPQCNPEELGKDYHKFLRKTDGIFADLCIMSLDEQSILDWFCHTTMFVDTFMVFQNFPLALLYSNYGECGVIVSAVRNAAKVTIADSTCKCTVYDESMLSTTSFLDNFIYVHHCFGNNADIVANMGDAILSLCYKIFDFSVRFACHGAESVLCENVYPNINGKGNVFLSKLNKCKDDHLFDLGELHDPILSERLVLWLSDKDQQALDGNSRILNTGTGHNVWQKIDSMIQDRHGALCIETCTDQPQGVQALNSFGLPTK